MVDELPVVDLADYLRGTPASRRRAVELAARAGERIGFLLLRGHGLDPALLARVRQVSATFFAADEATKLAYHLPEGSRGYTPMNTESLAATADFTEGSPPDIKEAFAIGAVDVPEHAAPFADAQRVGWPERPAGFQAAWLAYYRAVRVVAGQVMDLFADALGVPPAFFAAKLDRGPDCLRVVEYPEQAVSPPGGALRAGAHTDFGVLTLLSSDDAPGGLQVRLGNGEWFDVPRLPDAFTVNIGDLMAYWTNHRWISTVHRVVNPPAGVPGSRRQSVIFFHNPNVDAVIEPVPTCVGSREAAPAPVIAGEWLRAKTHRQRAAAG
ncbi:isopenicillin N synthase family dioxygenase [Kutzneria sp. CA-103260]|uniref:isopenicillin N synthase family dioxygenase n=1 Tax=Kutzneria sp. CA-103260 TaxID=2802641 RepID=UPI001BA89C21|nr:isopenicillin N synthase family oxygenase [Kutzneria sp. CA-103260]QUQ68812.1 oxidoreductase, 2OG-Fe(II) oxygenase [Kutzneria sp. CA-103260]